MNKDIIQDFPVKIKSGFDGGSPCLKGFGPFRGGA